MRAGSFTAGQVGVRPDGSIPEGFEAQHDQIWQNTLAILAVAGMGPEDMVRTQRVFDGPGRLAVRAGASREIPEAAPHARIHVGRGKPPRKSEVGR